MIKIYKELVQGSPEWLEARCGLLTASEMNRIITYERILADIEHANNPNKKVDVKKKPKTEIDKERRHLYELVAQRINKYTEPSYIGDDMLRGINDELEVKIIYQEKIAPVTDIGFITNDRWGFTIGYSPDALVGEDGLLEIKSKKQSLQMEVIINDVVPAEHVIQIQTGLMVSERKWIEFISYSVGMPLFIKKVYPDPVIQKAIIEAAKIFELAAKKKMDTYYENAKGLIMTERKIIEEIVV